MVGVEQRVIRDIRNELFTKLSELSLSFFHGRRTGQLISRVTNDVMLVRRALVATLANVFRETLLVAVFLALAVIVSWRLALITFVVLPPIVLVITRVGRRLRKRSARMQEKMADIASTLEETISGVRVVKAFGMEGYERRRFFRQTAEYFRRVIRLERLAALAGPLTEYLGVTGAVVVLWYGGREVLVEGTVTPDLFLMFLAAALSMLTPLRKLSRANNELQVGLAAAGRIFAILDTRPEITSRPGAAAVESFDDRIVYEGVGFRYSSGGEVLSSIDLEIAKGDVVAIVGPSGAGKSTLLDLLPRFYDPVGGRITIDGRDIRDVDLASLRRLMGIVTQETILFNDTVRNNIAYGMEGARDEEIVAAAKAANADRFIASMPQGYDTEIGERGVKLSGGERQRMAIARAILKNPPILIFDEATSSLDTESERLVQEAIERLLEGRTVLVIAHRLSTVRNADRIVVLDGGSITETGTHAELMELGGLYRHLHDMQFRDEPVRQNAAGSAAG
jgi:subfamily B ATP-binding cassette protein MsbA